MGDTYTQACMLDEDGEVIEESRVSTTPKAFRRRFATMPPARIILEAGVHSHWASRLFGELGHEVIIANPRMLRFIYGSDSKNDKADAAYLARVGKLDPALLHPVVHRSEQSQADLTLIRSRDALVRVRASLITHARGLVKVFGTKLPACSTEVFAQKAQGQVPELLRPALGPVLDIITSLTTQIREFDRKIGRWPRRRYPDTSLLSQVPGVGRLPRLPMCLPWKTRPFCPRPGGRFLPRTSSPASRLRRSQTAAADHQSRGRDATPSPRRVRPAYARALRARTAT